MRLPSHTPFAHAHSQHHATTSQILVPPHATKNRRRKKSPDNFPLTSPRNFTLVRLVKPPLYPPTSRECAGGREVAASGPKVGERHWPPWSGPLLLSFGRLGIMRASQCVIRTVFVSKYSDRSVPSRGMRTFPLYAAFFMLEWIILLSRILNVRIKLLSGIYQAEGSQKGS